MPKKSKKNPETLQKEFLVKTAHIVDKIVDWNEKLVKALQSRKYSLTDLQKDKARNTLEGSYADLVDAFEAEPSEKVEKKGFSF